MLYNYDIQNAFARLAIKGVRFFKIGKTSLGKPILCTHIGSRHGKQAIVVGATHAREYITTLLICRQIERFCKAPPKDVGIYFVPLLNPDGVDICINGVQNVYCKSMRKFLRTHNRGDNFSLFKANANLVDLNVNFDAQWGSGEKNIKHPGTENFIGYRPESEHEVRAITDLTRRVAPKVVLSYHSKGEVIYYKFNQTGAKLKADTAIARQIARQTGYKLSSPGQSAGGYKDWCIEALGLTALTIEVGSDDLPHPITGRNLPKILKQNLKTPDLLVSILQNSVL